MLAATDFEFKQRFWIIGAVFFFAFLSYSLDHQNAGTAVVDWIARVRGTTASNTDYHLIFFVGALFAVVAAAIRCAPQKPLPVQATISSSQYS